LSALRLDFNCLLGYLDYYDWKLEPSWIVVAHGNLDFLYEPGLQREEYKDASRFIAAEQGATATAGTAFIYAQIFRSFSFTLTLD
jgi:hypothetical protein